MEDETITASEIIAALGGATVLSKNPQIGASRSAVANWAQSGIPAKYWPAITRIAALKENATHITLAALESHSFPTKRAAA